LGETGIVGFHLKNPLEGYRRLTFMMLDADIVAVSPSSVWRVLSQAGLLSRWSGKPSKKGTGFAHPLTAHQHRHIDVSYLNIGGTFYYLCSILDGFSRYIVNWEIRESMTEADIETILQGAKEKCPEGRPRIISDNGPQFIAKDFKEFIRISGMTHVRTAPFYPQSSGKIERWHKSLKGECIRPGTPLSLDDACHLVQDYVDHYNNVRLNSATGYITPKEMLAARQQGIHAERDRKLEAARKQRQIRRQQAAGCTDIAPRCASFLLVMSPVQSHLAAGAQRLNFRLPTIRTELPRNYVGGQRHREQENPKKPLTAGGVRAYMCRIRRIVDDTSGTTVHGRCPNRSFLTWPGNSIAICARCGRSSIGPSKR
jgi:transposase InsO family protein